MTPHDAVRKALSNPAEPSAPRPQGSSAPHAPQVSPPVDASGPVSLGAAFDQIKAKGEAINTTPIAPKGDGAGLEPINTAATQVQTTLNTVSGMTVRPTGDPSGIATLTAAVDALIGKLAQVSTNISAAAASARSLAAGLPAGGGRVAGAMPAMSPRQAEQGRFG